ncbi:MAG: hypothetical protein ACE37F_00685 [Nannocystaceae bacterium]|nr:hypothetical protein [bacterium]
MMERLGEALELLESGEASEQALVTAPALAQALSALCLEDIANTYRVLAYGPAEDEPTNPNPLSVRN